MKLTYDPKINVAYLRFKEKPAEVQTLELSGDVNIDIASDGALYGIELLNANEQLQNEGDGSIFKMKRPATARK